MKSNEGRNYYIPINLNCMKCLDCGDLIAEGRLLAHVKICTLSTDFILLCNKCFERWMVRTIKEKLNGDISILKEIANDNGYILKKVLK